MRSPTDANWPDIALAAWKDTCSTLQLWTQIVGKIRLSQTPWLNHGWHVSLRGSARGFVTPLIPEGDAAFRRRVDFVAHELVIRVTDGGERRIELAARSVAEFYVQVLDALSALGIPV